MKKIIIAIFFAFFGLLFAPKTIFAAEIINDFQSEITVLTNGSIRVHEKITVNAEGDQIKHGIYRDIPTQYNEGEGKVYDVGFELEKVIQDGAPQTYFINGMNNGVRIYIGDKNTFVSSGEHTYEIYYSVARTLGYFESHDELYWNVTGNGWVFPITHAFARVTLPQGIPFGKITTDFYTGKMGSRDAFAQAQVGKDGTVFFETTKNLAKNEGLTIVIGWPKNFVAMPDVVYRTQVSSESTTKASPVELPPLAVQIVTAVVVFCFYLGYFLLMWHRAGRDPRSRTIIAQFEAPPGVSPAAARFLMRQNYDNKVMGAQLIDMASRGIIDIQKVENRKDYRLTKLDTSSKILSDEDRILLENLFTKDATTIEIDGYATQDTADRRRLRSAGDKLTKYFESIFFDKVLFKNRGKYWPGVLLLTPLALLAAMAPVYVKSVSDVLMGVIVIAWFVISYWCMSQILKLKIGKAADEVGFLRAIGGAIIKIIQAIFIFFVGIFGYFFATVVCFVFFISSGLVNYILLGAIIAVIIVFAKLMPRYSEEGARLVEHLEGLKLFLQATEKDRLEFHHPPEKTPELFQKNLGFACALGVEQQWGEQFAGTIFMASQEEQDRMISDAGKIRSYTYFVNDFKTFSSTISSATTSPRSRSGGGGGGFSGGGGGGGGGGGW